MSGEASATAYVIIDPVEISYNMTIGERYFIQNRVHQFTQDKTTTKVTIISVVIYNIESINIGWCLYRI